MAVVVAFMSFLALFPAASALVIPRQGVTALADDEVQSFAPLANFAAAAYCSSNLTQHWTCGGNCDALSEFIPTAAGGDGDSVQFWFVGYFPPLDAVVVAHQGTDPHEIEPLITDSDSFLSNLDSSIFPGISSDIKVHDGFAGAQAKTASDVLAAVQQTIDQQGTNNIILASHSLGAAISLLDAVMLQMQFPDASFQITNFGQPRVGNQAFADYIDSTFPGLLTHISNKEDLVPTLPGEFLGFHHPSGEVHIQDSGNFVSCPGQDSKLSGCTLAAVPNIFEGKISDHDGPYVGVHIGGCTGN